MLIAIRVMALVAVAGLYFMLGWLNWDLGARLMLLGATALMAVSAWTLRHGNETRPGKSLVVATGAFFIAMLCFHAFLRDFFGIQPDDSRTMATLFSSDRSEAGEFAHQHAWPIAKHVLAGLVALAAFSCVVWWKPRTGQTVESMSKRSWARWLALGSASVFVLLHLSPTLRNQNPVLYFPLRYSQWKAEVEAFGRLQADMAQAQNDPGLNSMRSIEDQPRTVVFIIGESLTRLNIPEAGYPRATTPQLSALGNELTWFTDVLSSDSSTCPSMEKMLTPATLAKPDLWLTKPDVLMMAKKTGYKTFWLSNHTTDANGQVWVFASHADEVVLTNKGGSRGEGTYDEVVLPYLAKALQDPAPRKFILIHLLNAHPAYYYRYPKAFAKFDGAEDAVTRDLKAAGRRFWAIHMRNCYDNAVLYADHVLRQSLDLCRASGQRLAWLFVPDHGQDAAHNSNFCGHNAAARSQFETFMVLWRSPNFPAPTIDAALLRSRPYQTDVLDHTLLGLLGISGDYFDPRGDLLSEHFQPVPRSINGEPYR